MTPLYTDLDLLNIAEELRDESSVKYLYNALDGLRQKYEARIAELTPPAPTPIDYEKPRVLVSRGESNEQGWWNE